MNSSEKNIFDVQVQNAFRFLAGLGYRYSGVKASRTAALGEYLEALWSQPASGLHVRAAYLPPVNPHPDVLRVFLEKEGESSFSIDAFLEFQRIDDKLPALSSYHGELPERLAAALDAARLVLERHLMPTLEGAVWRPVPVDWAGLR